MTRERSSPRRPTVRCAIYTRKSSEEGLDQDFNSLDAQRESGQAYIKSQAALGWVWVPEPYDDGGFSGGTMDRPALKRLMTQICAGRIDCVVVYKVDRLSRSLLDFARMMETFERHGVSFVSVTQQFNTASSMGRLILNVLLSFAQFEREMISERTRDKIAAARRKGKWAGGMPLLGYDVINRKLAINEAEARQVRDIFELYKARRSLLLVVQELARRGWAGKCWTTHKGRTRGGKLFNKPSLLHLLRNAIYTGKIRYRQETFDGEHPAIVDAKLFDEVQAILSGNGAARIYWADQEQPPPLRGLLRCKPCNTAMVHAYTMRGARRYRYYVCNNAQARGYAVCPSPTAPGAELERFVVDEIRTLACDPDLAVKLAAQNESPDHEEAIPLTATQATAVLAWFGTAWETWPAKDQAMIQYDGRGGTIEFALKAQGIASLLAEATAQESPA
jgi:site-specific DNA recombinase